MAASECRRGCSFREIRDHVAARDMPNAARAAKLALDRGAHLQLAKGALLALARADVDETRAAGVCEAFCRLMEAAAADRRHAAADVLAATMHAIAPARAAARPVAQLVNAAGAAVCMSQASPRRAADYAEAMSRTMPLGEAADVLAQACRRVAGLHGEQRDAAALTAFSRCPLFDRADVAAGARVLLQSCVRAAWTRGLVRDVAKPELVAALAARAPPAGPAGPDEPHHFDKLAVLWTFVQKDAGAIPEPEPERPASDARDTREVRVPAPHGRAGGRTRDPGARVLKV